MADADRREVGPADLILPGYIDGGFNPGNIVPN